MLVHLAFTKIEIVGEANCRGGESPNVLACYPPQGPPLLKAGL